MSDYHDPSTAENLSPEELRNAESQVQQVVMEAWFRSHFEDPANRTPYESAEGGYQWIWGGPFDAREELENKFSEIVSEKEIETLANQLDNENPEWAPIPSSEDLDDFLFGDIADITTFHLTFANAIMDIQILLETEVHEIAVPVFNRMLYANIITSLETYLSDAFIHTIKNHRVLMRRFIETTPNFKPEKILVSDIFKTMDEIDSLINSFFSDFVWHRFDRIMPMYNDTLAISFPIKLSWLFSAVLIRHDIIHRNGKTKDGSLQDISIDDANKLILNANALVAHIDEALKIRLEELSTSEDM